MVPFCGAKPRAYLARNTLFRQGKWRLPPPAAPTLNTPAHKATTNLFLTHRGGARLSGAARYALRARLWRTRHTTRDTFSLARRSCCTSQAFPLNSPSLLCASPLRLVPHVPYHPLRQNIAFHPHRRRFVYPPIIIYVPVRSMGPRCLFGPPIVRTLSPELPIRQIRHRGLRSTTLNGPHDPHPPPQSISQLSLPPLGSAPFFGPHPHLMPHRPKPFASTKLDAPHGRTPHTDRCSRGRGI